MAEFGSVGCIGISFNSLYTERLPLGKIDKIPTKEALMADAKPFTDEELEGLKQIKVHRPSEIVMFGDERISYARFLATIAARDTTIQQQADTIQRMRGALEAQKTLWEMVAVDLNGIDASRCQVPFMSLQDPMGVIDKALDTKEEK